MRMMGKYLQDLIPTAFELEIADELQVIGTGPVHFRVKLQEEIPKKELLKSTSLALGEAYMKGNLTVDRDLYEVLELLLQGMGRFSRNPRALRRILHTSLGKEQQKKQVMSHYDIGNEFYRLWLDETMSYSCAYFQKQDDTLFQAQVAKVDHILKKLNLKPGMRLLDIGCGWGFLMMRAARKFGVHCTGITLSRQQYQSVSDEIREQKLEELVEVRLMDYRDLKEWGRSFDRIVSVGMLEHVGRGNYSFFLEQAASVLRQGGLFLLHFISAQKEHEGDPWIRRYIFPGGVIPSFREIVYLLPDYGFCMQDTESLRRHYVKTLLCWRENFGQAVQTVREQYGEEFVRMWDLYLASCAAAFQNGIVDLHQLLLSKGVTDELPMCRTA